jgi:16S rRNA (guanine(1405)-N(7))-methyltransferase
MPTREDIIHGILAKKELGGIEHAFVGAVLDKELRKNPKIAKALDTLSARSAAYRNLIKAVRAVLRRNVGLFEGNPKHREALLAELRAARTQERREEITAHILSTHRSTRERLQFYDKVYGEIFARAGTPAVVLDIGCGINPVSYPDPNSTIMGVDVDRAACDFVNSYFSLAGIEGECKVVDVKGIEQIKKLPKADVALVFKLLDLVDHAVSEKLLEALPAKWIVVSFSTEKVSGKPMNVPRRMWFEQLLRRLGWKHEIFMIPNEIFYVLRKQ